MTWGYNDFIYIFEKHNHIAKQESTSSTMGCKVALVQSYTVYNFFYNVRNCR